MNPRLLKPHPLANLMPEMSADEFAALKEDIRQHGVREHVWTFEGQILDGRHRAKACDELGKEFQTREYTGTDPAAFVVSLNLHRRHLNGDQKRELAANLLKATPEKSDRQIAATLGVDHKTVAKVRTKTAGRGEIPHVVKRTDTKGRAQPATKPTKAKKLPPATNGMYFARAAIAELDQIQPGDRERAEAFQYVRQWLDDHEGVAEVQGAALHGVTGRAPVHTPPATPAEAA